MMTDAKTLAHEAKIGSPVCLEAPAGYGKTHLIAKAVALSSEGRQLILTHTHAGVRSLQKKMSVSKDGPGVPSSNYHLDTICGWAVRLASAYTDMSGLDEIEPGSKEYYTRACEGARLLLRAPVGERIIRASYNGVYVDEVQDCTTEQLDLIRDLALILPVRVLGDPMQAIFAFTNRMVDWNEDIIANFTALDPLTKPWRWEIEGASSELGEWLIGVRQDLRDPAYRLDLSHVPNGVVSIEKPGDMKPFEKRLGVCNAVSSKVKSALAVHHGSFHAKRSSQRLAWRTSNPWVCIEEMECKALLEFAERLDDSTDEGRVALVYGHAKDCCVRLGRYDFLLTPPHKARRSDLAVESNARLVLHELSRTSQPPVMKKALWALSGLPEVRVGRPDLWWATLSALDESSLGECESFTDAATAVRERRRFRGKRLPHRLISHTLLVKGLEFNEGIILDADEYTDHRDLYVAMTRASDSLTIITNRDEIKPA